MIFFRSLTPDEREMYIQFVVLACALKGLPALACRSHSLTLLLLMIITITIIIIIIIITMIMIMITIIIIIIIIINFTLAELRAAISKLKHNKGNDDAGLVPELLKCAPDCLLSDLLLLYNDVLYSGDLPPPWLITHFIMLPKSGRAKTTSDFRPIAIIRLFYKVFAYMLLARIEPLIEAGQPEEQHGFRPNRRLEEHLVTANLVVDKFFGIDMPVWVISLDLSKAFDRVDWNKLWAALLDHGVSEHIVWIIQCLYFSQRGCVRGELDISDEFPINGGVRQGCVLSPRLFTGVLQWAMRKWRSKVESKGFGIEMQDGMPRLLDLRFADDIFIFGSTSVECLELLDALEDDLDEVGLFLNLNKTVILTNEAQPPNFLQTRRQKLFASQSKFIRAQMVGVYFLHGKQRSHKIRRYTPSASCFKNIFLSQTNSLRPLGAFEGPIAIF